MRWDRIEASWEQLKDKFGFWPFRGSGDDSELIDLIGAKVSRLGQREEPQPAASRRKDRTNRSEFSLHIGC